MSRYLDLIRTPGVAPLLVAGAIGRLPYGMNLLAPVLLLRAEGFSYAEVFAAMVVVAGLGLAPSTAAAYALIGELAPEGATTESYGWQIVGYLIGGALGAWLGGIIVDELSVTAALALSPATAGCTVLVALAGVRSWAAGT